MSPSLFALVDASIGTAFSGASNSGFIEQGDLNPVRKSKGLIIKELSSDDFQISYNVNEGPCII